MLGNIILLKSSVIFLEKQGTLLISFWRNTKISLIYFNVVFAVFFNNKYYEFKSSISVDQKHAYFHILAVLKELSNFWEAHKMWERAVKMQILGLALTQERSPSIFQKDYFLEEANIIMKN